MQEPTQEQIVQIVKEQKTFFNSNATKDVAFRLEQLDKFEKVILKYSKEIDEALWKDLRKSPEEAYLTETSIVLGEIKFHKRNLKHWAKPQKVATPLHLFPSKSTVEAEPLGCSLIIAPWNYPFQLTMNVLVGAISAGCCAILKPSPDAPATELLMEKMIRETFDPAYISLIPGGLETNKVLLKQQFDIIFFTGSTRVGKIVMQAAAEHLTPVVLELGGKSPTIVDKSANIGIAARRIIWGKLINAGQTCVAPDYVYAHAAVKDELLLEMKKEIHKMYGDEVQKSRFYPRMIHERGFDRLVEFLKEGKVVTGGETDKTDLYIAPTILDEVKPEHAIMQEEIFGPILPILTFTDIREPLEYINAHDKPLALYYFGKKSAAKEVLSKTSSGGACVNDTIMNIANHNLPFGGVGSSGMNKYHGEESFLVFSNRKAVVKTGTWLDLPFKYAPFKLFNWIKGIV